MLRNFWKRLFLRDLTQTDRLSRINRLYSIRDPWNLESAPEQARYQQSNRIIENAFGKPDSILEIGSGEGTQTVQLLELTKNVQGIEVSPTAASRATSRVPTVPVHVGTAGSFRSQYPEKRFSLATAFEVLYYPRDPDEIILPMNQIADHCVASCYSKYVDRINPAIFRHCNPQTHEFESHGLHWIFWTWSNTSPRNL